MIKKYLMPGLGWRGFGVRRHDCALELADMSASSKAATCRCTPRAKARPAGRHRWCHAFLLFAVAAGLCLQNLPTSAAQSEWASIGPDGRLGYKSFQAGDH